MSPEARSENAILDASAASQPQFRAWRPAAGFPTPGDLCRRQTAGVHCPPRRRAGAPPTSPVSRRRVSLQGDLYRRQTARLLPSPRRAGAPPTSPVPRRQVSPPWGTLPALCGPSALRRRRPKAPPTGALAAQPAAASTALHGEPGNSNIVLGKRKIENLRREPWERPRGQPRSLHRPCAAVP